MRAFADRIYGSTIIQKQLDTKIVDSAIGIVRKLKTTTVKPGDFVIVPLLMDVVDVMPVLLVLTVLATIIL